jgi:hypothetical protein
MQLTRIAVVKMMGSGFDPDNVAKQAPGFDPDYVAKRNYLTRVVVAEIICACYCCLPVR